MDLSIIIVNYNTKNLLKKGLESIKSYPPSCKYEIFVVDNASTDDSVEYIKGMEPSIVSIINNENVGFSKANNQAIKNATGRYILLLNPDTEVLEDTLDKCIHYMDKHINIGILGCKVELVDGGLDLACRRSFPNLKNSLFKFLGLAQLFPKSKLFAGYNLTYLDENKSYSVDCVVGAFMMITRKTIKSIGLLDEDFFMYGEDIDWCYRTKQAGLDVFYYSDVSIIHHKRASSKQKKVKTIYEFHRAMFIFYKKHYKDKHWFIINFIVYAAIAMKLILVLIINMFKGRGRND